MKRKAIPKKTRFEVFKRDSFTCQYCGNKAPDVLLQIDHIKPVAKGGTNGILNLITSCVDCNSGKSANELSDVTVIEKQRKQLEQLEERRQQLEMMMQWHTGLQDHAELEIDKFLEYFNKANKTNIKLSDAGKSSAKKYIKQFGFARVLGAIDTVATKYHSLTDEQKFNKLGGILTYDNASEEERQIMYIKGICRNRFGYFDPKYATELLRECITAWKYEYLVDIAKTSKHWTQWREKMEYLIDVNDDKEENDNEPF